MSELRLSFSSISTFKQCPKRWKFRYIDNLEDPPGYPAVMGSFVHLVLEEFFKLDLFERDIENAKLLSRKIWDEYSCTENFINVVDQDEASLKEFRQKAWQSIRGIWEFEDPKKVNVIATEAPFKIVFEELDVAVTGYIDRIEAKNGKYEVGDYKTGKAPRKQYQQDKLLQLRIYGLAVNESTGEMPAKGKLLYLGSQIVGENYSQLKFRQVERVVTETAVKIRESKEENDFKAQVGPLCSWCSYIEHCEEGKNEIATRYKAGRLKKNAPAYELAKTLAGLSL